MKQSQSLTIARAYLAVATVYCIVALINVLVDWQSFLHPGWLGSRGLAAAAAAALGIGYGATFWRLGARRWADVAGWRLRALDRRVLGR